MEGYKGHRSPVRRQEPQCQLGQESHCGSASDAPGRPESYGGTETVHAVLVPSAYPSVSPAGSQWQRGLEQGHAITVPRVAIYEKCGFAFAFIAGHGASAIFVFVGMICSWEVCCGIICTALSLWVEILVAVFPLHKLH